MYIYRYLFIGFLFASFCLNAQDTIPLSNDSLVAYYYPNGKKSSEGYLTNGKPNGYWKTFYENGQLKSEGNRVQFLLEGSWKFYNESGTINVDISYEKGLKNGKRKSYKEGVLYKEEEFIADQKEGISRWYYKSGKLQKEVPYKKNRQQGRGFEYLESGEIQTLLGYRSGVLVKRQKINRTDKQGRRKGVWMDFYKNKRLREEGTYKDGLKDGYFKYYKSDGNLIKVEKYVKGVLQNAALETTKMDIKKTIHSNGRLKSKKSYRNGIPDGIHRDYSEEGKVIASVVYKMGTILGEGIYDEQGRKQGPWKEYYSTGELKAEGKYTDGLKTGSWTYYHLNGKTEQKGKYSKGNPNGLWTWYYDSGSVWREEEYFRGKEEGPSVEYNDTGKVITKGEYINGLKEGKWFYEVGDHREEGEYREDEQHGVWNYFYTRNGQLLFEGAYVDGLPDGKHTYYYSNGIVKRKGTYSMGEKIGIWEVYDELGSLSLTIEYKNGKEIRYNGVKIKYAINKEADE